MLKQHILKMKIAKPATAGEMTSLCREHFDPLWIGIALLLPFRCHYEDLDGTLIYCWSLIFYWHLVFFFTNNFIDSKDNHTKCLVVDNLLNNKSKIYYNTTFQQMILKKGISINLCKVNFCRVAKNQWFQTKTKSGSFCSNIDQFNSFRVHIDIWRR